MKAICLLFSLLTACTAQEYTDNNMIGCFNFSSNVTGNNEEPDSIYYESLAGLSEYPYEFGYGARLTEIKFCRHPDHWDIDGFSTNITNYT